MTAAVDGLLWRRHERVGLGVEDDWSTDANCQLLPSTLKVTRGLRTVVQADAVRIVERQVPIQARSTTP